MTIYVIGSGDIGTMVVPATTTTSILGSGDSGTVHVEVGGEPPTDTQLYLGAIDITESFIGGNTIEVFLGSEQIL